MHAYVSVTSCRSCDHSMTSCRSHDHSSPVKGSVTFRRRSSSSPLSPDCAQQPDPSSQTGLTGFTGYGVQWPSLSTSVPTPTSPAARMLSHQGGVCVCVCVCMCVCVCVCVCVREREREREREHTSLSLPPSLPPSLSPSLLPPFFLPPSLSPSSLPPSLQTLRRATGATSPLALSAHRAPRRSVQRRWRERGRQTTPQCTEWWSWPPPSTSGRPGNTSKTGFNNLLLQL